MSLTLSIATYFICWWMALFMVLPFGVRTQQEEGEVVPGSVESAPKTPHILKKFFYTSLLGFVFFCIAYSLYTYDIVNIDDIPLLPTFKNLD